MKTDIVKEQIYVEGLLFYGYGHLAPDEEDAATQLQEEIAQML